ncbi:superoxide dismutase family protein [Streptomyces sp. PLAI1-29]|uniref:Superoxide dismutase family protein n=2 Tax=Streptomyces zingiberis TaxID=2053010 RepID=A0ABX1BV23_9ACTN|nr:superoxide dismutase family protein [Streptomyces zingiberis]
MNGAGDGGPGTDLSGTGATLQELLFTGSIRRQDTSRTGSFVTPAGFRGAGAVTYDPAAVPPGARITVARRADASGTRVGLKVTGVQPGRTYGAHVHTRPCGKNPETAGPHYQNRPDPNQPSTSRRYANPRNEVWLDFTTDATGTGMAETRHRWHFRPGQARSVVLHEHATETKDGVAGDAGARVACYTVPLG